jgi:hypothetical protein
MDPDGSDMTQEMKVIEGKGNLHGVAIGIPPWKSRLRAACFRAKFVGILAGASCFHQNFCHPTIGLSFLYLQINILLLD